MGRAGELADRQTLAGARPPGEEHEPGGASPRGPGGEQRRALGNQHHPAYCLAAGAGVSPTLQIFAPTASSTRAPRMRNMLTPYVRSTSLPASKTPRTR